MELCHGCYVASARGDSGAETAFRDVLNDSKGVGPMYLCLEQPVDVGCPLGRK